MAWGSERAAVDAASGALTQATRMLEKKRELGELDAVLAQHKDDFRVKMEALQHRKVCFRALSGSLPSIRRLISPPQISLTIGGALSRRCKDELLRREAQLHESLTKFDRFVKDNDARRKRALLKAEEEGRAIARIDAQIAALEEHVATLAAQGVAQRADTASMQHFEQFLNQCAPRAARLRWS